MPHIVIGIDPSSKKMAACTSEVGGGNVSVSYIGLATDAHKRLAQVSKWASQLVADASRMAGIEGDVYVFLEEPIVWGSKKSTLVLGQISGACIAGLLMEQEDLSLITVNNARWKSQIIGVGTGPKGKVEKHDIAEHLRTHWKAAHDQCRTPRGAVDQDMCDASCMNLYGQLTVRKALKLSAVEFAPRLKVVRRRR